MRTHNGAAPTATPARKVAGRRALAALASGLMALGAAPSAPAVGAPSPPLTIDATISGAGTVTVGSTVFAKSGTVLTLTLATTGDARCVKVDGAFAGVQVSPTSRTSWTFNAPAGTTEGSQTITAGVSDTYNSNSGNGNNCTGGAVTDTATYAVDNTGPTLASAATPAPNAAGWNNTDVTVEWTASDTGSGVAGPQPFKTEKLTANGILTASAPAQSDRLGNTGQPGSATVRIDKVLPTITASQTNAGYGQPTTVTFTCTDPAAAGEATSGITSCRAGDSTSNSVTVSQNGTVTGTATDAAGNTKTLAVEVRNVDTTPPVLAGAPTTEPNGNGWYRDDVTVHWTATDPESGIPSAPADTTIAGQGEDLTSSVTVANGAGLTTTASSTPAVKIDRTPPSTGISGVSNAWTNGAVTVTLSPTDTLSGVDSTTYTVDGGAPQRGRSFSLTTEGVHAITYFSTDAAGNVEATRSAEVKIDKTAPQVGHSFTPDTYTDGAWSNENVTVAFTCTDAGGSELASCTSPVIVSSEGADQEVQGVATDNAGNSTSNVATVSIDKTPPTIEAHKSGVVNEAGWYNTPVTVSFTADDTLSGLASKTSNVQLVEGAGQSVTGTATDAAGNSASATASGIDIDLTAPELTGRFSAAWHRGDVTVDWTCTDTLSGPAGQPESTLVEGEGANLTATAECADVAGNSDSTTVDGIKIDRHAPTTVGHFDGDLVNDWYGGPVRVTLTPGTDLSGIAATYYTVDGGSPVTYEGPFDYDTEGEHTFTFWSRDVAGNVEEAGAPVTVKVDTTKPVTTIINPLSPETGWFVTSGIPFAFSATDGRSGIAGTYFTIDDGTATKYGQPFTQNLNDGRHTVSYWSVDLAGNVEASRSVEVNVDTVKPTITGTASPAANAFGWNNTSVDVTFECSDEGSGVKTGVAGCSGGTILANEGPHQSVTGDAVDVAGNHSTATVSGINIDRTRPTLTGVPTDPNGADWYNDDVTVTWLGDDALSGIDAATLPKPSRVQGEGRNLGAGPVTVQDKAGNVSLPASVAGLKIDRTAPSITGAPTTKPNAAGWYTTSVEVDFTCLDPELADGTDGSGVASCPTSSLLDGNGAGQTVTSGPARDMAGNQAPGTTVGDINIDGLAPSTAADNRCTTVNEWCKGDTADVILNAADQEGLSGVKEIHYTVDSGAEQVVAGASTTVSVPLSGSGAGTVKFWAVDNAGNKESVKGVALKWDNIAPTVTHTLDPAANAAGWSNADTTVHFAAKDDDKGSGVDQRTVTPDVRVTEETSGRDITGSATDLAGNTGTDRVTVKLDKTAPTISTATPTGKTGDNGWFTGPVTVSFSCDDGRSGVATCPDPVVVSANGTNTASGTVTDKAGNTASTTVTGIMIDQEMPTLTAADVNVSGATYTLGSAPKATCTGTDSVSGIASCTVTVTGGNANGVGTFDWSATAKDKAGNTTTVTGRYKVVYRFDGFLQPINDTAHQTGLMTSVFKAGSTIPVKLQVKRADGTVVQSAGAPSWLTPVKGGPMSLPVDESVQTVTADSGSSFRYDASAQQYIYNWKTGSGGNYWQIGARLDDGQIYYVNIGLR